MPDHDDDKPRMTVWEILASKADLIIVAALAGTPGVIGAVSAYRANERGKINTVAIQATTEAVQLNGAKTDALHTQIRSMASPTRSIKE